MGFVPCHPCVLWERSQSDRATRLTAILDTLVLWKQTAPLRESLKRSPLAFSTHSLDIDIRRLLHHIIHEAQNLDARASRFTRGTCTSPPPIHQAFHGTGLADIHHEPIRYPKPTLRLRQSFAAVSQAPQQLSSQRRVSKCCSDPARRIFGVACRVPGWREPTKLFSLTRAQHCRRF